MLKYYTAYRIFMLIPISLFFYPVIYLNPFISNIKHPIKINKR